MACRFMSRFSTFPIFVHPCHRTRTTPSSPPLAGENKIQVLCRRRSNRVYFVCFPRTTQISPVYSLEIQAMTIMRGCLNVEIGLHSASFNCATIKIIPAFRLAYTPSSMTVVHSMSHSGSHKTVRNPPEEIGKP
jgi:hypothetical protein